MASYYGIILTWGYFNNPSFLNANLHEPMMYILFPVFVLSAYYIRYIVNKVYDIAYGPDADQTEKIFRKKEFFNDWRTKLFGSLNNDKVNVPFGLLAVVVFLTLQFFMLRGYTLAGVNYFTDPFLTIAAIVNMIWWGCIYFAMGLGFILLVKTLYYISFIGKDIEKLSINDALNKYLSRLKGVEIKSESITYLDFQRRNRLIGAYLFNFSFRLIIFFLILATGSIFTVQVGIWTGEVTLLISILALIAVLVFFIPQYSIHSILKKTKGILIDVLRHLHDHLREEIGDHLYSTEPISPESLEFKLKKLEYAKTSLLEIGELGTWVYDFPEIMKLVAAAALSLIPITLELTSVF